jgi:hypothetical protein
VAKSFEGEGGKWTCGDFRAFADGERRTEKLAV